MAEEDNKETQDKEQIEEALENKDFLDVNQRMVADDKHSKITNKSKESKTKAKKILEDLKQKVADLEAEKTNFQEQFLRKRAEFDNFQKRMVKEKEEFVKYSLEKFCKELLPVLDSFNVALHPTNIPEEQKEVFAGFELIYKQFKDLLEKSGIKEIVAVGEMFNPNFHQAVSQEKSEEIESGKIIKEYQKGYKLHERILRPSMVVVSE